MRKIPVKCSYLHRGLQLQSVWIYLLERQAHSVNAELFPVEKNKIYIPGQSCQIDFLNILKVT